MGRLQDTFAGLKHEGRAGLVAYITCGFPSLDESPGLVRAALEGGADIIEIGVPFSDPLADGRTIQKADEVALANGVGLPECLELAAELRAAGVEAPLVLMGYLNPILAMGQQSFVTRAAEAGVDGVIVVDLPAEEAGDFRELCRARGIDLIFLVAPTTSDERIQRSAALASGFIYCVSLTGTTGARRELPPGLGELVGRIRKHSDLPVAVGFGISTREHFELVAGIADAVVIGTAIIDVIGRSERSRRCDDLREYVEAISGRRRADVQPNP
ncbi:MAG: tryptophan synthase subunit alpha [Dehalococcoidia bacterium]